MKILHKAGPISLPKHPRCTAIATRQMVQKLARQVDRRNGNTDEVSRRRRRMRLDGKF